MGFHKIIFFFICLIPFSGISFNEISVGSNLAFQTEEKKELFDREQLETFQADEDYDYSIEKNTTNWWTDFKEWLNAQWQKLFGGLSPDSLWYKFLDALPYLVIPLAVILIVWLLVRTNPGSQVMRQHNKSKVILTEEEELLMKRDLESLAEEAISRHELRLAIRYLYLHCIKRLDMKRIITYANDKTNYEYIKEIKIIEISRTFRSLTLTYEQIWYGHLVFDDAFFEKFKKQYSKFHGILDQKQYAQI